jgi:hypothetical protein
MFTRGGRVVALLFLLWFIGLALAGLGILPAGDVPLGHVVQQSPAPLAPALRNPPAAYRHATAGSLSAAAQRSLASRLHGQAAVAVGGTTAGHSRAGARHPGSHGSAGKPGAGTPASGAKPVSGTGVPGAPGTATTKSNGTAPGRTRKTTTPGYTKSSTSPGHTKTTITTTTTTTTTPGQSGSATGKTVTHTQAHASNG